MKILTDEQYREKFKKQFEESKFKLEPDEQIVQCHKPHPPYWFISNHARLFSVYGDIKLMRMYFRQIGKKNKDGERSGYDWYYEYGKVFANKPSNQKIAVHKLVAEHFLKSDFEINDANPTEVHHKVGKKNFNPDEGYAANSANNLQILPRSHHRKLNSFAKPPEEYDKAAQAAADKKGVPTVQLTQEQILALLGTYNITDATLYLSSFHKDDGKLVESMVLPIAIEFKNKI